jgi:2-dehydro-3-deoxyphosphogluconate aldolase / (4S)-4-hydroxy-2-oxoglutarate aldolase
MAFSDLEQATFANLRAARVVAVLMIDRVEDAVPVAEALLAGGVRAMELTLRTPAAMGALREIKRSVPEMMAGIGTILRPEQVSEVVEAGGSFGVAPGMNRRVVEAALAAGLPFAPGICTPSDIEAALEYDRTVLKFFPAEPSGGLPYLDAIAAPYAHLGLRYLPLGGIHEGNLQTWIENRHVGAVGGSWLAGKEAIMRRDWTGITEKAQRAMALAGSSSERRA